MNPASEVVMSITLQSLEVSNGANNILTPLRAVAIVELKKISADDGATGNIPGSFKSKTAFYIV